MKSPLRCLVSKTKAKTKMKLKTYSKVYHKEYIRITIDGIQFDIIQAPTLVDKPS